MTFMSRFRISTTAVVLTLVPLGAIGAETLQSIQSIPLPGVEGRIDHFSFDVKTNRLFMAALGNDSVEVIDLGSNRVSARIKDLKAPQGVAFAPDSNRLAVANDQDGSVRLYDGASLGLVHTINLEDDADNVRYDPAVRRFWVGYGGGGLAAIDPQSGKVLANVKLDAHPESFQLETNGKRIFANVAAAAQVAVVDREAATVIARWRLTEAESNFPMALDEGGHRLFVGCRKPAKLVVLDTETGKSVGSVEIVGDADDLFYDPRKKRIYVAGGEGRITVINQTDAEHYAVAGQIETAPGARTGYFVRETGTFYLAVPHRGAQAAEVRVLRAEP
jgi:YVTN family beta-propeller protein